MQFMNASVSGILCICFKFIANIFKLHFGTLHFGLNLVNYMWRTSIDVFLDPVPWESTMDSNYAVHISRLLPGKCIFSNIFSNEFQISVLLHFGNID